LDYPPCYIRDMAGAWLVQMVLDWLRSCVFLFLVVATGSGLNPVARSEIYHDDMRFSRSANQAIGSSEGRVSLGQDQ